MATRTILRHTWSVVLILLVVAGEVTTVAGQSKRSPADTVKEFYKAMREKRFREAFSISIYKPAIEGLTDAEFEDLRGDFERLALAIAEKIPGDVSVTGEQISGDRATVFVKVKDPDGADQTEPVMLMLLDGSWILGDKDNQAIVAKAGKEFFFTARIDTHHNEVQDIFKRIALAQLAYSQQRNGQFGDLAALITAGLLPKDLEGTATTGYRFRVNVSADKKSWQATAEPAQYGRTGKLSFYMDAAGVRNGDVAGKPLPIQPEP